MMEGKIIYHFAYHHFANSPPPCLCVRILA